MMSPAIQVMKTPSRERGPKTARNPNWRLPGPIQRAMRRHTRQMPM